MPSEERDRRGRLAAVIVTLGMLFACIAPAYAQPTFLQSIEAKRTQIERTLAGVEQTSEELRDGLQFRVDKLTIELGEQLLAVPIAEVDSQENEAQFVAQIEWLQTLIAERYERLQQRIRDERERFDQFDDGVQATISRAFQQDLRKISSQYVDLLVDLMALRERLGRVDAEAREQLRSTVTLVAERLSGQIMLDSMTLAELRTMQRVDPVDTELSRAIGVLERKQNRSIESLDRLVGLMERLEMGAGSYRALLLAERGSVGVELLDREVFMTLLRSRLSSARQQLTTTGPNILLKAFVFLAIVGLTYFLAKLIQSLVRALLHRKTIELHQLLENTLISISFGLVIIVGVIIALSTIGISLVPMLAGLGVAGIVIGFALQDTLSNFASGWMILVYRPYDVDDHVKAGGVEGVVKRMNLVSTTIATFDNQRLVVPNSRIWGDVITNLTANNTRRLNIPVSVAYGEDLDRVEAVLREEIEKQEGILKKPEPNVFVDTLGSSEIVMMTHAWVRTRDYWTLLRALTKRLKQRLDDEDMEIPYPQQDVYIRSFPGVPAPVPGDIEPIGTNNDSTNTNGKR